MVPAVTFDAAAFFLPSCQLMFANYGLQSTLFPFLSDLPISELLKALAHTASDILFAIGKDPFGSSFLQ